MLHIFRQKNIRRTVFWAVTGIIIVSFGFGFGVSSYSDKFSLTDAAGKAFGKKISIKTFQEQYRATIDQALLVHGENFQKIQAYLDLEGETWSRLLLEIEANQRKITASDTEVVSTIAQMPFFQRDGAFDRALYENILKHVFQRSARDFEEGIRAQVKIRKLFYAETMGLQVSDEAVRKEYERRNQKTQVSYVMVDPATFAKEITLDDATLQSYYDAHREEFLSPDAIKVTWVSVPFDEKTKTDSKKTADALSKEATTQNDLKAAAKAAGLTAQTTDFFSMNEPVMSIGWSLDLLQKVFETKKGVVLAPEETGNAFQILQVVDQRPALIPEFAQAKESIRQRLTDEKTAILAKAKADDLEKKIRTAITGGQMFEASVKALDLTAKTTPFLAIGDYIPEIGISEDFQKAAADLNKDQRLSPVVTTAKGPAILYWEAIEPIDEKKFEDAKKDFTETMYQEQRIATMNRVIQEIKEKAKLEVYLGKDQKTGKR